MFFPFRPWSGFLLYKSIQGPEQSKEVEFDTFERKLILSSISPKDFTP